MASSENSKIKYTVETSFSGVSFVYFDGKVFCAVHHLQAGGVDAGKQRAQQIADMFNNEK